MKNAEQGYAQRLLAAVDELNEMADEEEVSADEFGRRFAEFRRQLEHPRPGGREGEHPSWITTVQGLEHDLELLEAQQRVGGPTYLLEVLLKGRAPHRNLDYIRRLQTGDFEVPSDGPTYTEIDLTELTHLRRKLRKSFSKADKHLARLVERDRLRKQFEGPTDHERRMFPAMDTRYPR